MVTRRSNSWLDFLCEGGTTLMPRGVHIPPSMLEQFPEEVENDKIIYVDTTDWVVCPRILRSKNCDCRRNCPCLHPDFVGGFWGVPDLICRKWFQGICGYDSRCWNQHADTFDEAMRAANQVQALLRGSRTPFSYETTDKGILQQVSRAEASRMITTTMARYRLDDFTHDYDYPNWDIHKMPSVFVPQEEQRHLERRGFRRDASPHGRGRGASPRRGLSPRAPHQQPAAWTDRPRVSTPCSPPSDRLADYTNELILRWSRDGDRVSAELGSHALDQNLFPPRRCRGDGGPHSAISSTTMAGRRGSTKRNEEVQRARSWQARTEWINESARPATPPTTRPSADQMVQVKAMPKLLHYDTLSDAFGIFTRKRSDSTRRFSHRDTQLLNLVSRPVDTSTATPCFLFDFGADDLTGWQRRGYAAPGKPPLRRLCPGCSLGDYLYYVDQVLNCPTHKSTLAQFGLFLDLPVHCPDQHALDERVLLLGVPNNFNDLRSTLTYSVAWHSVTASLADLRHASTDRFARLRIWCFCSRDMHRLSVNCAAYPPMSDMMRRFSSATLDCDDDQDLFPFYDGGEPPFPSVHAFKKASEKMGTANLRHFTYPDATDAELIEIWKMDVGRDGKVWRDSDANLVEQGHEDGTKSVVGDFDDDTKCGQYAKLYFDAMWDHQRNSWVRKPVFYVNNRSTSDINYNGCLEISIKPSKRQPPDVQHRIQGVLISFGHKNLVLTPCPARAKTMWQQIDKHLAENRLAPEEARKMAGKCIFLTGRLFGKVGREPLKAIYARANINTYSLDKPTRASLLALKDIIFTIQADDDPSVYRPGDEDLPTWNSDSTKDIENGWAFIYLLEAWAAILASLIFEPWLGNFYIQCCDNEVNIADAISRFEDIDQAREWLLLELLLAQITDRAAKIKGDIDFASKNGFSDLPGIDRLHRILAEKDR
ncbi:unnamed protein product [Symbiodinium sp. CCMP2456]|nr:unnamed protein product [Symbiodinium sp. CCMP2456]